jgi:hypothetical protein
MKKGQSGRGKEAEWFCSLPDLVIKEIPRVAEDDVSNPTHHDSHLIRVQSVFHSWLNTSI